MRFRVIIALLLLANGMMAQNFTPQATLQPSQIQIGEQARLCISVAQDADTYVSMPILSDTVTAGVEIVERLPIDTIALDNNRIQIKQEYVVTSFDSGFYFIPPYIFATQIDSLQTSPIGLSVTTVAVNAQTDDIKTIKPIMDAPLLWSEIFTWVGYGLLVLLLIGVIVLLLLKFVFKKKVPFIQPQPQPIIPPHIVALNRLEAIKAEKTWQSGNIKAFYTDITDVLRVYIEGRFQINAMELTSDEIMALVKKVPEMDEIRQQLKELLTLADYVKFAKMVPLENENEQSLLTAFDVVDKTKPVEEENVESHLYSGKLES